MEFIFELLIELIIEGSIEGSTNKKIPLTIRIILGAIVALFFFGVTFALIALGIIVSNKRWEGIFIVIIGILFLVLSIFKMYKLYIEKDSKEKN